MAQEFRFVISNERLKNFKIDPGKSKDFDDYYITREKRVRFFIRSFDEKTGKFFLIESEPGSIIKKSREIKIEEAQALIKNSIVIIRKKGYGHIEIGKIQGYAENVRVFINSDSEPIMDEIHIEFEENPKKINHLKKIISPVEIIQKGLFDYVKTKI